MYHDAEMGKKKGVISYLKNAEHSEDYTGRFQKIRG